MNKKDKNLKPLTKSLKIPKKIIEIINTFKEGITFKECLETIDLIYNPCLEYKLSYNKLYQTLQHYRKELVYLNIIIEQTEEQGKEL